MQKQLAYVMILAFGAMTIATGGWHLSKYAYASTAGQEILSAGITDTVKLQPVPQAHSSELTVMDAPENFASVIAKLGFTLSEKLYLKELDTVAYRILPPTGVSLTTAEEQLTARFPDIIVQNSEIDMSPSTAENVESSF